MYRPLTPLQAPWGLACFWAQEFRAIQPYQLHFSISPFSSLTLIGFGSITQRGSAALCNVESSSTATLFGGEQLHLRLMVQLCPRRCRVSAFKEGHGHRPEWTFLFRSVKNKKLCDCCAWNLFQKLFKNVCKLCKVMLFIKLWKYIYVYNLFYNYSRGGIKVTLNIFCHYIYVRICN